MNPEITRIIEQYLQNELSESDRLAFEKKLAENPKLQQEVELHRNLHAGAKRAAQRTQVRKTGKRYHFRKKMIQAGVALAAAAVAGGAIWLAVELSKAKETGATEAEWSALIEHIDELTPMEGIEPEYFNLAKEDTVVLSESGVLLSVPESAFLLDGKPYSGPKVIQWQEARDAADIVKAGLSTMSGNRLLETQGMFGLQAFTPEGKQLDVNPKTGVYVQVPVDELEEGMLLFEGKQTKNGLVDWQNPQQLEKLPVMADMSELDFYPPGYEDELDNLQWKTGKKDRDSLYLSFEEQFSLGGQHSSEVKDETDAIFSYIDSAPASNSDRYYSGTTYHYARNRYDLNVTCTFTSNQSGRLVISGTLTSPVKVLAEEGKKEILEINATHPDAVFSHYGSESRMVGANECRVTSVYNFTLKTKADVRILGELFFLVNKNQAKTMLPLELAFLNRTSPKTTAFRGILPSKVLAFWKPEFNKTILSTRDFEKRMRSVHGTCTQAVLDKYTDNLNKPLHEIDAMVASMGFPQFDEFAKERVGGVQLDNPHMNNLRRFYAHAVSQLKKEAKKDRNFIRKQEIAWNNRISEARSDETKRTDKREAQNYTEEYDLNYANAARQLGYKTVGFTIRRGGRSRGTAPAVNVYNLDKFVADVTTSRTTGTFTDPNTGKQATITYNDFSATVNDSKQYEKLFLYLFPHELNSFQRIDGKEGLFDYRLNNDIVYDLAIVAINEGGYYLYEKTGLNKGALGNVSLEQVSEEVFNNRIEALNNNRNDKPMKISSELDWLLKEQKDYKVQRLRKENAAFRARIYPKVFPCGGGIEVEPVADTIVQL